MPTPTDEADAAALELALEHFRALGPGDADRLDELLAEQPREQVARVAAYACQCATLRLKPWQWPPCWVNDPDDPDDPADMQERAAAELLRRMLRAGVSKYHPDPPAALAVAEKGSPRSRGGRAG
jgi:hypothetical protein